ncbi:MAG: hypothetical protein WB766_21580 [Roseiarcus sp.]
MNRHPPAQRVDDLRIERNEADGDPGGDDGVASPGEFGANDARLLGEIARQTLNFAFGVALAEERRLDSLSDLDHGVGLRSEHRHPGRLGTEFAGFGVVRLAPSETGEVFARPAGVAGGGINLRAERRTERKAIDDVFRTGRPGDCAGGRLWSDGNGNWSGGSGRSSEGAFGEILSNSRIVWSNPTARKLLG